jgi:hypothetical protein
VRHVISALALALWVLGCASKAPPGEPVELLTARLGCYAGGEGGATGTLAVDPKHGTSFLGHPVMWPAGYTARRVGAEVMVLDRDGEVKATTGRTYHISRAYAPDDGMYGPYKDDAFPVAADCTYHHDFIDCTANPTDLWCKPPEPPFPTQTPPP